VSFSAADLFWVGMLFVWAGLFIVELKIGKTFGRGSHTQGAESYLVLGADGYSGCLHCDVLHLVASE
jgi:hypothetical protein